MILATAFAFFAGLMLGFLLARAWDEHDDDRDDEGDAA